MKLLSVRLADDEKARLQAGANAAGFTLSDYVRFLLNLRDERLGEIEDRLSALELEVRGP